jgi:hypothetical protein
MLRSNLADQELPNMRCDLAVVRLQRGVSGIEKVFSAGGGTGRDDRGIMALRRR